MICLLDTIVTPDVGPITRFRRTRRGYKGLTTAYIVVLGLKVLHISIEISPSTPPKEVHKRIGYALEKMHAERVARVLFSRDFPNRELVLREGFDEADDRLLREIITGKIVSSISGKDKVAAIFARRLYGEAERVFCEMCRDYKYVMAAVESDGGLFHTMGRRLGISVIGQPTEKQLAKADVAVFFSPPDYRTVLPESCVAIPVDEAALQRVVCKKAVTGLTVGLLTGKSAGLPDGFSPEPLYAAALDAGTLRREDIGVTDLKIREMYA